MQAFQRAAALLIVTVSITTAGSLAANEPYHQHENIVYTEAHGVGLVMDVFVPTGKTNGLGIIDVISGAWHSDRGKIRDHKLARMYDIFCSRGYTVFAVRPGSVSKFTGLEMLDHLQRGIRWVKDHADEYGVDPDRLGMTGASAGGHLASLAAVSASANDGKTAVKAVGVFFPPTDLLGLAEKDPELKSDDRLIGALRAVGFNNRLEGVDRQQIAETLTKLSPALLVTGHEPPFLLIHGDADPIVPLAQSELLKQRLEEKGVPVKLIVKPGGGHPWLTIHEEVAVLADWFDEQLALANGERTDPPAVEGGLTSELVFPLHDQHNHAPGIVECPNGDLLVSWYRGSGERTADDVAVYGARLRKGDREWSEPFLMADHPAFPDCNTCMMIDSQQRLWLFWPIILANSWESCLTRLKVSSDYMKDGPPVWEREDTIFLKPDDFSDKAIELLDQLLTDSGIALSERQQSYFDTLRTRLNDKLLQRLGWQPRCKPTVLPSGRILLPLYSDTYSFGLMAISDDEGANWYASQPLMGFGGIQPAVVRRNDGTLVAYMRENGPHDKIRVSESTDDGITWGPVGVIDLPNPGSGLDAVRLDSGHWVLIYNDTTRGRNSLAVSLSDDEGRTWKWTRHLERQDSGSYHYPAIIQGEDDTIHAIYSYFVEGGKSMKHAAFTENWIRGE